MIKNVQARFGTTRLSPRTYLSAGRTEPGPFKGLGTFRNRPLKCQEGHSKLYKSLNWVSA